MQEATQDIQEEGMAFLETVTEKLKQKLAQLYETLLDGQKEIDQMQEYFWDNYTEMDEYGYEYYDNQQALLQQVNANQNTLSMKHRLESLLDSPFFGRVDFLYDGDEEPESFYISISLSKAYIILPFFILYCPFAVISPVIIPAGAS